MIHVENLTKSFRDLRRGQVLAVDRISFDAIPGEVFGLLGPNGAGKTTTMHMLCTVLKPTGGFATLAGFDVATQPHLVRQNIGFLSASTAIYDRMTAWEMVEIFGTLYGLTPKSCANAWKPSSPPSNERFPRRSRRQNVHRHETKSLDRPGDHPRPAGDDFR